MEHSFDKDYWERHWHGRAEHGIGGEMIVNEHLVREIRDLSPGTAIDAGCGEGAEAIWLARAGWQVTAVDISGEALQRAALRAAVRHAGPVEVRWVEADLSSWVPHGQFDLVTTHYAHPAIPQLEFYERLAGWVAPGGTLLIVGHLHTPAQHHGDHDHSGHAHDNRPPEHASVTAAAVAAILDPAQWDIVTTDEVTRTMPDRQGGSVQLNDVVVRATRRRPSRDAQTSDKAPS